MQLSAYYFETNIAVITVIPNVLESDLYNPSVNRNYINSNI